MLRMVPNILETSSVLHVALLVFLRLLAILTPFKYQEIHIKLRHVSIVIIWLISICIHLIETVTSITFHMDFFSFPYKYFVVHVFHTIPIVGIVIMYVGLLWILKKKRNQAKQNMTDVGTTINMKMALLVQRVVIFLLVCYVPFLAWKQYFYAIPAQRIPFTLCNNEVK